METQIIKLMEKGLQRGRRGRPRLPQGCAERTLETAHDLDRLVGVQM
jgi:hypothetical protein